MTGTTRTNTRVNVPAEVRPGFDFADGAASMSISGHKFLGVTRWTDRYGLVRADLETPRLAAAQMSFEDRASMAAWLHNVGGAFVEFTLTAATPDQVA